MTKKELIEMLNDPMKGISDDAEMLAFDGDAATKCPVTGIVYGGQDNTVELCIDLID